MKPKKDEGNSGSNGIIDMKLFLKLCKLPRRHERNNGCVYSTCSIVTLLLVS